MSPLQGFENLDLRTFTLGLHPRVGYFVPSGLFLSSNKPKKDIFIR